MPRPRVGRVTAESPNRKWPPFQLHPNYSQKDMEPLFFVAIASGIGNTCERL